MVWSRHAVPHAWLVKNVTLILIHLGFAIGKMGIAIHWFIQHMGSVKN